MGKKEPFTIEDHERFAKDLSEVQELLGKWAQRFGDTFRLDSRQCKKLWKMLRDTNNLRFCLENEWYKRNEEIWGKKDQDKWCYDNPYSNYHEEKWPKGNNWTGY